jgi:hypothetical protein
VGAGDLDIPLPLDGTAGIECRVADSSNQRLVVISLNNEIIAGDVVLTAGNATSNYVARTGNSLYVYLNATDTQTATLKIQNVTDRFQQTMPAVTVRVAFLLGDANGDGVVNSADATITRNRSGQSTDAANFRADFNADGAINSADSTIARARSGHSLSTTDVPARRALLSK